MRCSDAPTGDGGVGLAGYAMVLGPKRVPLRVSQPGNEPAMKVAVIATNAHCVSIASVRQTRRTVTGVDSYPGVTWQGGRCVRHERCRLP